MSEVATEVRNGAGGPPLSEGGASGTGVLQLGLGHPGDRLLGPYEQRAAEELARRDLDRLREIGWHARVHVRGDDLLEFSDILKSVKDVPMVIDHLGHVHFEGGFDRPVVRWILDMLKHENWWMMTSNGNRDSTMESGWDDAVPYGKAFVQAAPDHMVWATDWPHAGWTKRMMNEAEEVELLYRYVDHDPALIRKILVDNPARLHGFTD